MGVGFKNDGMNRRIHPLKDSKEHDINEWEDVFRTFKKEPIKINYIKQVIGDCFGSKKIY